MNISHSSQRPPEEIDLVVIVHNVRSAFNVGAIFRTADGVGVKKIFLTGYSASPIKKGALYKTSAQKMLSKTALGAEEYVPWQMKTRISDVLQNLQKQEFEIIALEQAEKSIPYNTYAPKKNKIALIVGNEPKGIDARVLHKCDTIIDIPMRGQKKSLNVSVAFGIAAYELKRKKL